MNTVEIDSTVNIPAKSEALAATKYPPGRPLREEEEEVMAARIRKPRNMKGEHLRCDFAPNAGSKFGARKC